MPPTLTRSCVHWMITATFCTFTCELTVINEMIRILLTTFPAHFTSSTIMLMVPIFLAFVTSQWVGYVLLDPLHCKANFYFFRYFGGLNCIIYVFVSIVFPSFLIDTLFTSVTHCIFSSLFISSMGAQREFFTSHNPLTYVQGFVGVSFDADIMKLCHFQ